MKHTSMKRVFTVLLAALMLATCAVGLIIPTSAAEVSVQNGTGNRGAVGEHPGVGHDLMGIDEAIRRDDVLLGGGVLTVDGLHDGLALTEGLGEILGEGDLHLGQSVLLLAVHVEEAQVAGRVLIGPDTRLTPGLHHGEEVLTRGLGIELDLVGGVVAHGVESLGGDGLGGHRGLGITRPLVEGQGTGRIIGRPGRHGEGEGGEFAVDDGAVGIVAADTYGTAVACAVLNRHLGGGGGDDQAQGAGRQHKGSQQGGHDAFDV